MVSATPSYRSVRRAVFTLPFHQSFGQRPNSLAQHTAILLCEQLSNERQGSCRKPVGDSVKICRVTRARSA